MILLAPGRVDQGVILLVFEGPVDASINTAIHSTNASVRRGMETGVK